MNYNIIKSGREPSSHLSELIVSSCNNVVVGKSNHVFIIRDPHAILSSFDLNSRKDKSNIIYDNHNVYDKSYEQCKIVVS